MEFKNIKELVTLIDSTEIMELEIENDGFRIYLRKEEKTGTSVVQTTEELVNTSRVRPVAVSSANKDPKSSVFEESVDRVNLGEISAPMVGTFYRAPAPDAEPYIQVGDTIAKGQILFIIEAMKMMNEIESEGRGVIKEILVADGEPVEYGQTLLLIDPLD